ncbi:MAG: PD40 domain-containing protein [Chloroflexi bacterium]|nr:PD40 domain-containing protein [Chloroflexota bacterium]
MQRKVYPMIARLLILGCMAVIAVWALAGGFSARQATTPPADVANVPQQQGKAQAPAVPVVPAPQGTRQIPLPIITPSRTPLPSTPTPAPLQAAAIVTSSLVTSVTMGLTANAPVQSAINSSVPIHSITWAPTSDKLIYVTDAGGLYWANLDGTNATLLHTYDQDAIWNLLADQQPKSNTLFVPHIDKSIQTPSSSGHLDVVRFSVGQAPTIEEVLDTGPVLNIHWWSATRASGIVRGDYIGGDKLVTLDANGHIVETRNVPYMRAGAVQPGGRWLAYVTDQQTTDTVFHGSSPETVYLLDLATGQRLQITTPGAGVDVHSWSPDGNWFLMDATVGGCIEGVLVSADGQQQADVQPSCGHGLYNGVWKPDSKQIAYSVQEGGQDEPNSPSAPLTSHTYIIDVPARKSGIVGNIGSGAAEEGSIMRPAWSPDGSQLAVLSFSANCKPWPCSDITPALYLLATK